MRKKTERKLLSDRGLKALAKKQAMGKQHTIWDTLNPHFGVRVSAGGKLAFVVMRRPAGGTKPIRVTLGHYPALSLETARELASGALSELIAGKRPRQERQRRQEEQREIDEQIFGAVADRYKHHIAKRRTVGQIKQLIDRELVSRWGARPIASLSRREVISMVEQVRGHNGPAAARQALIYAKRIFGFAVARDLLANSPADHVSALELIGEKKPRQRVLTADEIRLLWAATPWNTASDVEVHERGRWPAAPFARLLLLLGVRRGELGSATWDRVDLDARTWLIPASAAKTEEAHLVPLPLTAVEIFKSLPRFVGGNLVFTNDGKHRLGGWNRFKDELDRKMGKIERWTFHDLRRTARSNWSALGVQPHIAEMMLGHAQPNINATYDVYTYEHERRVALEKWSRRIAEIVAPPPPEADNVFQLRG
jgi:integrase